MDWDEAIEIDNQGEVSPIVIDQSPQSMSQCISMEGKAGAPAMLQAPRSFPAIMRRTGSSIRPEPGHTTVTLTSTVWTQKT
jgi:hypothetical protein